MSDNETNSFLLVNNMPQWTQFSIIGIVFLPLFIWQVYFVFCVGTFATRMYNSSQIKKQRIEKKDATEKREDN